MRPFEFLEPASLKEACSLLTEYKEEAKLIAGGQSLVPLLKARLIAPKYLINIKGLPGLEYIKANGNGIRIGALTTHRAVETSPLIKEKLPVLTEMEHVVGSVQIRNWGTIGGDLAHGDPAGDPAPILIALGARVKATSVRGVREIPLAEFFVDYLETVLEPDEILTEIEIPTMGANTRAIYWKESVRLGDYPIAAVAVVVTVAKGVVTKAGIVFGAAGRTPLEARAAEAVLVGKRATRELLEEVGRAVMTEVQPMTDIEGSAEYKRELARVITRNALRQALGLV